MTKKINVVFIALIIISIFSFLVSCGDKKTYEDSLSGVLSEVESENASQGESLVFISSDGSEELSEDSSEESSEDSNEESSEDSSEESPEDSSEESSEDSSEESSEDSSEESSEYSSEESSEDSSEESSEDSSEESSEDNSEESSEDSSEESSEDSVLDEYKDLESVKAIDSLTDEYSETMHISMKGEVLYLNIPFTMEINLYEDYINEKSFSTNLVQGAGSVLTSQKILIENGVTYVANDLEKKYYVSSYDSKEYLETLLSQVKTVKTSVETVAGEKYTVDLFTHKNGASVGFYTKNGVLKYIAIDRGVESPFGKILYEISVSNDISKADFSIPEGYTLIKK